MYLYLNRSPPATNNHTAPFEVFCTEGRQVDDSLSHLTFPFVTHLKRPLLACERLFFFLPCHYLLIRQDLCLAWLTCPCSRSSKTACHDFNLEKDLIYYLLLFSSFDLKLGSAIRVVALSCTLARSRRLLSKNSVIETCTFRLWFIWLRVCFDRSNDFRRLCNHVTRLPACLTALCQSDASVSSECGSFFN